MTEYRAENSKHERFLKICSGNFRHKAAYVKRYGGIVLVDSTNCKINYLLGESESMVKVNVFLRARFFHATGSVIYAVPEKPWLVENFGSVWGS